MSYIPEQLLLDDINARQGLVKFFQYTNKGDTLDYISTTGYFIPDPSNMYDKTGLMEVNDTLLAEGSDGVNFYRISALSPLIQVEEISHSSKSALLPMNWTGIYASPVEGDIFYSSYGSIVTLNFSQVTGTQTSSTALTSQTNLPTELQPASDKFFILSVDDNGHKSGVMKIEGLGSSVPGSITVYADPARSSFSGTGTGALESTSVTYCLNT